MFQWHTKKQSIIMHEASKVSQSEILKSSTVYNADANANAAAKYGIGVDSVISDD